MITIRPYVASDWPALFTLLRATFSGGDTYVYPPDISEADAHQAWIDIPTATLLAVSEPGDILGTYFLRPNQPGLGSHVCNCGYMVAEAAAGQGVATALCEHSQRLAIAMGFRAMQYNFVVSTNHRAVRLWQHLGYAIVGRLPGAFAHHTLGFVDVFVMFKQLVAESAGGEPL